MIPTEYVLLVTDENLVVQGDPIVCWTQLDITLRFNQPGSTTLTMPGYDWIRAQMAPGNRMVVVRYLDPALGVPGSVVIAGPIETWLYERSDDGANAGDGVLTVNSTDDLAWIAARNTYPNPAKTPELQDVDVWTFTGNAESAIRAGINLNAGPGALAARRVPQLVLGAVAGVGTSITVTADRMEPLADVLRRAALAGGGLGFRTRQVGNQIVADVYQPTNVSGNVRFGFGLGNMQYLSFQNDAPSATTAVVGGQGDGADRFVLQRTNSTAEAAWGRSETLVSRPGNGATADLQTDGDNALNDGKETARITANVSDTPLQRYGVHYDVGSQVAIESWPGQQIVDTVNTVHIQVWPTAGEVVAATIGSQANQTDPAWIKRMRDMELRLGRVERNLTPSSP